MAKLIKCIECGKSISNEAGMCPRCKTEHPRGERCIVCEKILPVSKGKYIDLSSKDAVSPCRIFGHTACLAKITPYQQIVCRVCKKSFPIDWNSSCDKCGHPLRREWCGYCGVYLNPNIAVKSWHDDGSVTREDFYHKACYSSRKSSSCFIATAACGSPLAPEVKTLRTFRDNMLRKHYFGIKFISLYESVSPPFAHIIARNEVLRYLTRILIVYPAAQLAKLALKRSKMQS